VGFIVNNSETDSRAVVRFHNKRGTAEQRIKGGTLAVKMTRLSSYRCCPNEVRSVAERDGQQSGEPLAPAGAKEDRQVVADEFAAEVVKTGGRLVWSSARVITGCCWQSRLTRRLFGAIMRRIASAAPLFRRLLEADLNGDMGSGVAMSLRGMEDSFALPIISLALTSRYGSVRNPAIDYMQGHPTKLAKALARQRPKDEKREDFIKNLRDVIEREETQS
jgi:hypothetical protein